MIQLITNDEKTIINLTVASAISVTAEKAIVLMDSQHLNGEERDMMNNLDGFFLSLHPDQDAIKTKSHFITTSIKYGGSSETLKDDQWLIEFELVEGGAS